MSKTLYKDEFTFVTINKGEFFNKINISFLKKTCTLEEWNNFCYFLENVFLKKLIDSPFIIIIDCSGLYLLSIQKLKDIRNILVEKEEFIDKYWIETHFIIESMLSKGIANLFLSLYKPRKPYKIFYSLGESEEYITTTINNIKLN